MNFRPHRRHALVARMRSAERRLRDLLDPTLPATPDEIKHAIEEARGTLAGVADVLEETTPDAAQEGTHGS